MSGVRSLGAALLSSRTHKRPPAAERLLAPVPLWHSASPLVASFEGGKCSLRFVDCVAVLKQRSLGMFKPARKARRLQLRLLDPLAHCLPAIRIGFVTFPSFRIATNELTTLLCHKCSYRLKSVSAVFLLRKRPPALAFLLHGYTRCAHYPREASIRYPNP